MTIDEAIKHAKEQKEIFGGAHGEFLGNVSAWLEELKRWRTTVVNENIKNDFANRSTLICHNCDHKDEYIEELEYELGKKTKL